MTKPKYAFGDYEYAEIWGDEPHEEHHDVSKEHSEFRDSTARPLALVLVCIILTLFIVLN